jgi:hypothetical protein
MGDDFDIKFSVLPPDLQMKLWVLALDANTSKVAIAYRNGSFVSSLAYNYGGNVQAALSIRAFTGTFGVNPSNGNLDLGLVYRGFRFGSSASFTQRSAGLNFGFGSALLPFPSELAGVFNNGATGLQSMAGDIAAAPNNPLAWYKLHSDDAAAIGKAVSTGQQIYKLQQSQDKFGVGLRLNFTQQTGLTIYGGVLMRF